jgi:predicted acylesterase/phospholipase RssA
MPYYENIILSGGSIKTISLLGALQYCEDQDLVSGIKNYVGSSAGAIINYLLIIGYSPLEIISYICTRDIMLLLKKFNLYDFVNDFGMASFIPLQEVIERMTIEKIGTLMTLGELQTRTEKTLWVVAYNYSKRQCEYLSASTTPNIPCVTALRMSCTVPFLFEPFMYNGSMYLDGSLCRSIPPRDILDYTAKTLFLNISTQQTTEVQTKPENLIDYVYNVMDIVTSGYGDTNPPEITDTINIYTDMGFFDFDSTTSEKLDVFCSGYNQVKTYFEPSL